ncbi:unnamed protein product [Rotaria sp. Silwood2]|nr:unnamed protein product [Rotaria sp. Silwood2]CAF4064457.1 unnamed protein product [Rotaria sp. Silwood2]CAF4085584.1 unnamed protein product [Rotaria sp. Silwood2]
MKAVSKDRQRTVHVVSLSELSLSPKEESKLPNDLPTLLSNLHNILLKKSPDTDEIDFNTSQCIESIQSKIQELPILIQPTEIFDILQATLKTYIDELLSIKTCPKVISNNSFQEIFNSLISTQVTLDLSSIFENNLFYARTVFYRSFDLISLPLIVDFLNDKYPSELFSHMTLIFCTIINYIDSASRHVIFKKDDLQNLVSSMHLLIEYVDKNKQNSNVTCISITVHSILLCFVTLTDKTILVPSIIETKCSNYVLKWISMQDLSLDIQRICMYILYNIARHDQGAEALNKANGINIVKDFQQRVLKPNKDNNNELYTELRLFYCMILSLLTEPKENQEDLYNLRQILDQLMQLVVDGGQSVDNRCNGFHVSEPIVILTKLCVHDKILKYVLNESSVINMKAKSRIDCFCELLLKFRGALASENDLDQLSLTALFNILWSISFHDEYIEELKSNSKLLITIKSLANDHGEAWVDQYVSKHMSSVSKAASGILWNLDENNPARTVRTITVPETKKELPSDINITNRMRVMVSYSHADKEFCHQFVDALQKDDRLQIWIDFAYCHTEDFWEEIGQAIEQSNVVLFLMSKDYQDSKSCRQEVMYAKHSLKKRFIPIYIKKDFVATGWLGVRIVGPQYIRFEKKSFNDTIKELIKLIIEDKKHQEYDKKKVAEPSTTSPRVLENKPIENTNNQIKPNEDNHIKANRKSSKKSVEQWTKEDIAQWFDDNCIHQELIDLYDFRHGIDLLLYGQCLRPDWQIEYNAISERYEEKYNTKLYRDQFVRFVGAVNRLQPSNSKLCIIS